MAFSGAGHGRAEPGPAAAIDWIVDITADRFGADPVIVTPACAPRYGARATPHSPGSSRRGAGLWTLFGQCGAHGALAAEGPHVSPHLTGPAR